MSMNLNLKLLLIKVSRIVTGLFHVEPINYKKIVYISFGGKQMSCNPLYIYRALERLYPGKYNHIWVKETSDAKGFETVKSCSHGTISFFRHMLTAGCVITNDTLPSYLNFSQKQLVINTWHGGGLFKQTFGLCSASEIKYNKAIQNIHNSDIKLYTLSSCSWHENVVVRRFGYAGESLNSGMPRNDILFSDRNIITNKIKQYFKIPIDNKIVLYAPTFRGNANNASEGIDQFETINIIKLLSVLKSKFGCVFTFIFRGHHLMSRGLTDCINASHYPDMQELLSAADVFISDYSSCLWDFSLTMRPCFIFAPDFDIYSVRPGFESDYHQWPFPIAKSNKELNDNIFEFDNDIYSLKCQKYHNEYGSFEDGHASERIAQYVNDKLSM